MTVTDCAIVGNQALGGAGGQGANGGDGLGGGVAVANGASAALIDSLDAFNDALGGEEGHGQGGSDGQGVGGGVYVFSGGTFSFDATTDIKHNHASTSNNDIFGP